MYNFSSLHIIKVLERHGFVFKSQKGSHVKMVSGTKTVIIPHPKKQIPTGTFLSITRQSGLNKSDF
jgi:predicted RNA binding protein YcfA (HicA-like mRNA interferase family)